MVKKYTFRKEERLRSKRLIEDLFRHGSSFFIYPFRVSFKRVAGLLPKVQVIVSVPKRRFPRAVDRNLLKRRIKEAYRLQKDDELVPAFEEQPYGMLIAFQFVGKELADYALIHRRMADVLQRLKDEAS